MDNKIRKNNLDVPTGKIDVLLDTDAYNEIDDQFAIAYLLKSSDKLNAVGFNAAPFFNGRSNGPEDGMCRSYDEIKKIIALAGRPDLPVYYGSRRFMENESDIVSSPAAENLAKIAMNYSPEHPLYVVAIGAITNIAAAILTNPEIIDKIVISWLGGHARHMADTREFNMRQDVAAARVVMSSGVPLIQLPCNGVVSEFRVSGPELDFWLRGKNELADYLAKNTVAAIHPNIIDTAWTRVIWDVTAVAWLLNDEDRFLQSRITPTFLPGYDNKYEAAPIDVEMRYVYKINRDALMTDLFEKLLK